MWGQLQIDMRQAHRSGVYNLSFNPAMVVQSPQKWDLQVGAAGIHLLNDYAYIRQTNTFKLLTKLDAQVSFTTETYEETPIPDNLIQIAFEDSQRTHFVYFDLQIEGPAFVRKIDPYWSVGIFTRWRLMGGIQQIPRNATYDIYDALPYEHTFSLEESRLSLLHWQEVGFHVSHKRDAPFGYFSFGMNFKLLRTLDAGYLNTQNTISATKYPGDRLLVQNAIYRFGFTDDKRRGAPYQLNGNGGGASIDLGFSWVIVNDQDPYDWRLGLSLLDLGRTGARTKAESHSFDIPTGYFVTTDLFDQETLGAVMRDLSGIVYEDSLRSLRSDRINIWTPTSLSLQVERRIWKDLFAYGVWVQRLAMPGATVERSNVLQAGLRYERNWFEVSASLRSVNNGRLITGFSGRLGPVSVGSANMGSLFGKRDWWGTDLYLALRLDAVMMKWMDRKYKHPRRSKVKCYQF